jgi:hypothetical protein
MLLVVAFISGEGAPVAGGDGGMALECQCGRRKVRAASNGDNGGGWKGITMKRQRRWHSVRNWRGGRGLRWRKPVRRARRQWRRRGARAWAWAWTRSGVRRRCLLQIDVRAGRAMRFEYNSNSNEFKLPQNLPNFDRSKTPFPSPKNLK